MNKQRPNKLVAQAIVYCIHHPLAVPRLRLAQSLSTFILIPTTLPVGLMISRANDMRRSHCPVAVAFLSTRRERPWY
jgi:hypothetical protein